MARKQQRSSRRSGSQPQTHRGGSNQLRIIAGQWRGRKLPFPDQPGLRPTPDRVRETLFNWLQATVPGARCLDLFSGSGALGLEALSRGAASATLVDSSALVIKQLGENLQRLEADNADLVQADAHAWLQRQSIPEQRYDLVFLDPPFRQQLLAPCGQLLEQRGLLTDNALIYIEVEREMIELPIPSNWQILRHKDSGQVSSYLCQHHP